MNAATSFIVAESRFGFRTRVSRNFINQFYVTVKAAGKSRTVFGSAFWAEHERNRTPDALLMSVLPRERNRRKVILLISDGINGPQFNHHSFEETRNALLNDNISVFCVAVGSNSFHSKFELIRNYANDSGGDIYFATKREQMEKLYSQITEQARHEYMLAYVPKVHEAMTNYHSVRVTIAREGLVAETRRGYYASS